MQTTANSVHDELTELRNRVAILEKENASLKAAMTKAIPQSKHWHGEDVLTKDLVDYVCSGTQRHWRAHSYNWEDVMTGAALAVEGIIKGYRTVGKED